MADYISILDKAVSGLSENSPENRIIIYDKARAAIERKLRAMDPVPPEEAITRQLGLLEEAISSVEADHRVAPVDDKGSESTQTVPVDDGADTRETPASAVAAETSPEPRSVTGTATPSKATSVPEGFIDDVILIDGIGEKTASLLEAQGIAGISQIAAMDDDDLAAVTEKIGFAGFEKTQEWKIQARDMLGGALPRSKTDQGRLEKLREERGAVLNTATAEGGSLPSSETVLQPETTPQSEIEPDTSINNETGISDVTGISMEAGAIDAAPQVTSPVVDEPVLDTVKQIPTETPELANPNQTYQPSGAFGENGSESGATNTAQPTQEAGSVDELLKSLDQASATQNEPSTAAGTQTAGESNPQSPVEAPVEAPVYVNQLENDPASSPANDPFLERPVDMAPVKKSGFGKALATGSIFLILGAAAAGAYVYRDQLVDIGNKGMTAANELIASFNNDKTAPKTENEADKTAPKTEPEVSNEAEPKTDAPVKNSARLGSDGSQTVEEPASDAPAIVEPEVTQPTDTATLEPVTPAAPAKPDATQPETAEVQEEAKPTVEPEAEPQTTQEVANDTAAAEPVVSGEKSFLYEEALGTTGANRDEGNMVWSLVKEPPEAGAPPEAEIKGVLEIPSRGLTLNLTIKRNVDPGLPASHIIELAFTAPAEFSGGNVDGISRFVMKSTEQARGESLVGVPARIDTGLFLIALNNLEQAQQTNLKLLENAEWIDIPVTYLTGRRALLTFEKGATGKDVFAEALADWKNR